MMYFLLFSLSILVIPAAACEGQCIVDITHAFLGNYTTPIQNVFSDVAIKISKHILHSQDVVAVSKMMEPLLNAYSHGAYDAMEKAIFPSYFHGKCQVNGVDPTGCPNPDCPVVCGTPGSLVHFYSVLQEIAFNTTASKLASLCASSSKAYQTFQNGVLHELGAQHSRRSLPFGSRRPHSVPRDDATAAIGKRTTNTDRDDAKTQLKSICQGMVQDLTNQCGGSASLSKCSWEPEMKAFILSFP